MMHMAPGKPSPLPGWFSARVFYRSTFRMVYPLLHLLYMAAISACHNHIDGVSVGGHPLISHFLHSARWLRPVCRLQVPFWYLYIVLEGLHEVPFKPLLSYLIGLLMQLPGRLVLSTDIHKV